MLFTRCVVWHGALYWQCQAAGLTLESRDPREALGFENCLSLQAGSGGRSELQLICLQLTLTRGLLRKNTTLKNKKDGKAVEQMTE